MIRVVRKARHRGTATKEGHRTKDLFAKTLVRS